MAKARSSVILVTVAGIAAGLAFTAMRNVTFLTHLERIVEDIRTATLLPPEPQDDRVVIVAVTEDTLSLFPYRSPVDREFIAGLLRQLDERQPAVIGLDVLFDQETEPEKDRALKATLRELKTPVVASYTENPQIVDAAQLAYVRDFVPPVMRAHAELATDPTGAVVRWIFPGAVDADGSFVDGFAAAVADRAGVHANVGPAEEIVWHGRPDRDTPAFRVFPAHAIGVLPREWFKDKVVLIGEIVSLTDRHRTPFASVYAGLDGELAGVEIQAHAVSQLINQRHSRRLGLAGELALLALLALLGATFSLLQHGVGRQIVQGSLLLGATWAAGFALIHYAGVMVPLIEPTLGFLLASWGADTVTGRDARRQKEFIQSAFGRYLNPQLVKQLAGDPGRLKLGGEMRDMTLMFCDVRSFTTISERFDANGLTRFINSFLTPMTDVILAAGGTIDKYMGDAIMAFWNAPLDDAHHAEHACRAALRMRTELVRLNEAWRADAEAEGLAFDEVRIGIGLNTGECCVGNMGSDQRFDYSVLGDNVNLCSRLEGQTKSYGVDIIVSETTAAEAPGFAVLELDLIRLKGKTRPARIFALLGDETLAENPAFQTLKANHDAMIAAYRNCDWAGAREMLRLCRGEAPELIQGFYVLYEERIAEFEAEPPPQGWDGVHVALSK
jgi:adenylate cyclase